MQPASGRHPLPAPMLWPVVFWVTGIAIAQLVPLPWYGISGVATVLLILAILIPKARPALILILFMSLGALRVQAEFQPPSALQAGLSERGSIRQEVTFTVLRPISERAYAVRLSKLAQLEVDAHLLLFESSEFIAGASYKALADLQELSGDPILDIYPSRYVGSLKLVLPALRNPEAAKLSFSARAALFVMQRLDRLPPEHAALARALLLSDPSHKKAQQGLLTRAGISHLVVVSGLHVLLLYFILITLLRFFLPARLADLMFIIFICGFAALNHWAAPISRAILMISLSILAKWLSRPLSAAQNLSVSLFVITLVRPAELFSVGLQLSFAAVAIIIFALPSLPRPKDISWFKRNIYTLANYMLLSLIVGLGLLPLTLHYFGTASLNSVIANLLGLPLMAVLLGLALTILAFPYAPFYLAYSFVAELWQSWLKLCAALPFQIQDYWLPSSQSFSLLLLLLLLALALKTRWKLLKYAALPLLAGAALLYFWPIAQAARIIVFNAGTADCSLIFSTDGQSIMIDSGGISSMRAESSLSDADEIYEQSWLRKRLLSWLMRAQIRKLDYLLITHLHSDHAGGMPALFKHLQVKHLIISQSALDSDDWHALKAHLELSHTQIIAIRDTCSFSFGQQRLKILHPDRRYEGQDLNNRSIVCRFDDGQTAYLFTGDIEAEAEAYLVANYAAELSAQYLKVPHHGSRSSSSARFLEAVGAQEGWLCCASRNVHGFPHPEALSRLQAAELQLQYSYKGSIVRPLSQKD